MNYLSASDSDSDLFIPVQYVTSSDDETPTSSHSVSNCSTNSHSASKSPAEPSSPEMFIPIQYDYSDDAVSDGENLGESDKTDEDAKDAHNITEPSQDSVVESITQVIDNTEVISTNEVITTTKKSKRKKKKKAASKPKVKETSKKSHEDLLMEELIAENAKLIKANPKLDINSTPTTTNTKSKVLTKLAIREKLESRQNRELIEKIDRGASKVRQSREAAKREQQNAKGVTTTNGVTTNTNGTTTSTGMQNGIFKFGSNEAPPDSPNGSQTTSAHLTSTLSKFNTLTSDLLKDVLPTFSVSDSSSSGSPPLEPSDNIKAKLSKTNTNTTTTNNVKSTTTKPMENSVFSMFNKCINEETSEEDLHGFFQAVGLGDASQRPKPISKEIRLMQLQGGLTSGAINLEHAIDQMSQEEEEEDVFYEVVQRQKVMEMILDTSTPKPKVVKNNKSNKRIPSTAKGKSKSKAKSPVNAVSAADEARFIQSREKIRTYMRRYFDKIKMDLVEHMLHTHEFLDTIVNLSKFEQGLDSADLMITWNAMANVVATKYGTVYKINNPRCGLTGNPDVDLRTQQSRNNYYEALLKQCVAEAMTEKVTEMDKAGIFKKYDPQVSPMVMCTFQRHLADLLPKADMIISMDELIKAKLAPANARMFNPFGKKLVAYAMFWSFNLKFNLFGAFYRCEKKSDGSDGGLNYYWVMYDRTSNDIQSILDTSISIVKDPVTVNDFTSIEIGYDGISSDVKIDLDFSDSSGKVVGVQLTGQGNNPNSMIKCQDACEHCQIISECQEVEAEPTGEVKLPQVQTLLSDSGTLEVNRSYTTDDTTALDLGHIELGAKNSLSNLVLDQQIRTPVRADVFENLQVPISLNLHPKPSDSDRFVPNPSNQNQIDIKDYFTEDELANMVVEMMPYDPARDRTVVNAELDKQNKISSLKICFAAGLNDLERMKMLADIMLPSNMKFIKERALQKLGRTI